MSTWKVILATVVIFGTGVFTGGLLVKTTSKPTLPPPAFQGRLDLVRRLTRELDLVPEQREKIDKSLRESGERVRILNELIGPEMRDEFKAVHENIRAVLTPVQHKRFEELFRERQRLNQEKPPLNNFRPLPQHDGQPFNRMRGNNQTPDGQRVPPRERPNAEPAPPDNR